MTIAEVFNFFKNNPLTLTVPISIIGLVYGVRSYKINRTRLGLDRFKIFNDFANGLEILKRTQDKIDMLSVKSNKDITKQNLDNDLVLVDDIIGYLNNNEDRIRSVFILPAEISELRERFEELKLAITQTTFQIENDFKAYYNVKSKYGFAYLQTFLMMPNALPKEYKAEEVTEKLNHMRFFNYYIDLILNPQLSPL